MKPKFYLPVYKHDNKILSVFEDLHGLFEKVNLLTSSSKPCHVTTLPLLPHPQNLPTKNKCQSMEYHPRIMMKHGHNNWDYV